MATRILAVVDRLQDTDSYAPGARLRFYESGTTTPISVFSDASLETEFSQPVTCDEYGTAPPIYYSGTAPYRVLATDEDDAPLPGFPRDDMVGIPADLTGASSIPFTPTETLPFTTVQAAIEGAAALVTDQTDTQDRSLTPWTTAGSGNAYTITPTPVLDGYGTFLALRVKFDRANTGAITLNVNGLGTRDVKKMERSGTPAALASGDIQPYDVYDLTYDGTQFVIVGGMVYQGGTSPTGYRRYWDGYQVIWTEATFTFNSTSSLIYDWTFPVAFAARPRVHYILPSPTAGTYTGTDPREITSATQGASSASAQVILRTYPGSAALAASASVTNVGLTAIGRWF